MKIDNYISELLYEHDCVIVTDLGGFITHYRPATLNKTVNTLHPPSKKVAFNASLKTNDGLLAHYISNREALNYAEATKVISEFAQQAKAQMLAGRKLKIEKVGILYHDKDKNIQFLPDQNANYLIDSFGLTPVLAKMIHREKSLTQESVAIPEFDNYNQDVKRKPFKWKLVEVIPAAAILVFLLMVPPVLDKFNTNVSSLLPFSRINEYLDNFKGITHERAPIVIDYPNPFEIPPSDNINNPAINTTEKEVEAGNESELSESVEMDLKNETPGSVEEVLSPEEDELDTAVDHNSMTGFHVIGGCFQYQSNAESLVKQLASRDIKAEIIGQNKNGLYMVSLFNGTNFNEARKALDEIKATAISTAWIYKK